MQSVKSVVFQCTQYRISRHQAGNVSNEKPLTPLTTLTGHERKPMSESISALNMQCLQCGEAIGPGSREIVIRSTSTGELALLHLDCLDQWLRKGPAQ